MTMTTRRTLFAGAALAALMPVGAVAQSGTISLQLNWNAGGDHAPLYYALSQGWYAEAGVTLEIRQGSGSGMAAQAVSLGQADVAIIDTPTALQFIGEGSPITGIFVAYNDSPYGIYWRRSSGIETPADLAGHRMGAPAFDAARQMWVPIAKALDLDPDSVEWVNIQPTAKVAALQSGTIDATTHFYSVHFVYEDVFGDDLAFMLLRDTGLNPYGLAYFANNDAIEAKADAMEAMVQVTQRAFAFCLETPEPCAEALSRAVSMRPSDALRELEYAGRVMPGTDNPLAVGAWDVERMQQAYEMVAESFEITAFDSETAFTNQFINPDIAYPGQ